MSAVSGLTEAFTENDESIKHLLRQVVYMFYPHQCIIIMEAILFHNVLFEDDLIKLCCMHKKVFRSFCNKLIEDKLLFSHVQKEETQPYKLFTRAYYYVHNIEAIDSIKWKIHTIVKKVKEEIGNFSEPQGYICPTCHNKYTLLDAASLLTDDKLNFECSVCNDYLIDDDISQEQRKGQEKLEKLMSLVEPIIQYLKIVDDLKIDDNNFESTLMKYVPAFSDSLALYSMSTRSTARRRNYNHNADDDNSDPTKRAQATIHVSITADDEDLKRERQKREDRNRKLRQNALPSWHQESTVGKSALGRIDGEIDMEGMEDDGTTQIGQEGSITGGGAESIKQEGGASEMGDADAATVVATARADGIKHENESASPLNTTPMANVNLGGESASSLPSLISDATTTNTSAPSTASTFATGNNNTQNISSANGSLPDSAAPPISSSNRSANGGDATTTEELDALSAYYSQLRQRQAAEEEEEEEEDELENLEGIEEMDDEEMEAFNDDLKTDAEPKQASQNKPQEVKTEQLPTTTATEDIDEDDFDLEMFESDEN